MRAVWRWTMWITFLRLWPATGPSQQRPAPTANTAPICCNRTPATPSTTVSLSLSLQIHFLLSLFDSSVSLSLLLLSLCPLKLSFYSLCFVIAFCMINNSFDNVPLVIFNCLSHNTLHSPHDWPCSSWKYIALLSLLANICGQRLPYCPLSRPTVCEYNTHMPNIIAEKV